MSVFESVYVLGDGVSTITLDDCEAIGVALDNLDLWYTVEHLEAECIEM